MSLLIDIDALCKLAHWGLLAHLPRFSGFEWVDCATLQSAKFRARKSSAQPDGRLFQSSQAAGEVLRVTGFMSATLAPDIEQLAILQDLPGVDAGEALLFASIAASNKHRLLTGDKRAVRAIAALPGQRRLPYARKIIVVEQVLKATLMDFGIDKFRERVCPWVDIDIAVRNVMGSKCDAAETSIRDGLDSYINEMAGLCTPSLVSDLEIFP